MPHFEEKKTMMQEPSVLKYEVVERIVKVYGVLYYHPLLEHTVSYPHKLISHEAVLYV
jgi:hypothetical protein